jgi:hypothetical protein
MGGLAITQIDRHRLFALRGEPRPGVITFGEAITEQDAETNHLAKPFAKGNISGLRLMGHEVVPSTIGEALKHGLGK